MDIKVCGLTGRQNIEAVLAAGPGYLGFIFYPLSKRCIDEDPELARFIRLLTDARKVGVFVNATVAEVLDKVWRYALDTVQLHGSETPEYCRQLHARVQVWKAFAIQDDFDFKSLEAYSSCCDRFLFDTPGAGYGGTGRSFDWSRLEGKPMPLPFMISGGIGPGDEAKIKAIQLQGFKGIDLNSRFEISPGLKDAARIKKFIHAVQHR